MKRNELKECFVNKILVFEGMFCEDNWFLRKCFVEGMFCGGNNLWRECFVMKFWVFE